MIVACETLPTQTDKLEESPANVLVSSSTKGMYPAVAQHIFYREFMHTYPTISQDEFQQRFPQYLEARLLEVFPELLEPGDVMASIDAFKAQLMQHNGGKGANLQSVEEQDFFSLRGGADTRNGNG